MRSWLIGCVLGLGFVTGRVEAAEPPAKAPKGGDWFTDYAAARAAARETGKPLFVVFRCQP